MSLEHRKVRYEIVESGTKRGGKKLVSSEGYSYTLKTAGPRTTIWRCSVRRKDLWCRAVVSQRGNEFVCGSVDHIHPPEAGLLKRTVIAAKVRVEAIQHPYRASGDIVEDAFSITNENDFNLPNQQYLQRAANRIRQKLRPAEPKDLTFEIDQRFLGCEDFIQGDVRVENERHILLATPLQKELLKTAKNWYLDGTFKIIRRPFEQLFSIHGFIQKDDCMKQVPLLFVLMSRRRKRDYVAVFQKIRSLLPDLAVEGFVMDFERATWSAVEEVFPDARVQGCSFHWGQVVMRKVANLGLKTTYEERQGVHRLIRKLLALPFLPPGHIRGAFDNLKQLATTQPLRR